MFNDFCNFFDRTAGPIREARKAWWLSVQALHVQKLRLLGNRGRISSLGAAPNAKDARPSKI